MGGRQLIFQKLKSAANGQNLFDRVDDVKFAIDKLEELNNTDPSFKGQLDLSEIAVAGHSFGALTSLVIAGQREAGKSFEDKRVKAAVYLCPPVKAGKSSPEEAYGSIALPGLLLTGTKDDSPIGETSAAERRIPFDAIKAPHQYIATFEGADHSVFGGRGFRAPLATEGDTQKMVQELSTKFLDAALKNDNRAWHWLDSKEATDYLGKAAVYERK
jgi:predicted dienelactone hydrolase